MPVVVWSVILGSRLLGFLVAYYTMAHLHMRAAAESLTYNRGQLLHGLAGNLLNPWANWDGQWYVLIARTGYRGGADAAFFPLYPMLLRWLAPLTGGKYIIAGVVISLLFFVAAMYLLYRLVEIDYGRRVAGLTVAFASLFPTSFFYQAVYTESAFLFFVVACLFFARRQQWLFAGIAGFFAALTRNTGVLLLLPMALFYFGARAWRPWRIDWRAAWFALVPAGLGMWMVFLKLKLGDALAFSHAQVHWDRSFALPWLTVWRGISAGVTGLQDLSSHGVTYYTAPATGAMPVASGLVHRGLPNAVAFLTFAAAVIVLALTVRRLKLPYTAYAALTLIVPLFYPTAHQPLYSMSRFVLAVFPVFLGLAILTQRHKVAQIVTLAASTAGLVVLTVVFARFMFIA